MHRLFVLIPAILVFFSLTTPVALAQDPATGKTTWEQQVWQCQRCHGPAGEGLFGPPLAGTAKTAQEFITQVRTPRRFMPSFSEAQVSDQQIMDIHAYLASLAEPASFTPKDPGTFPDPGQNLMAQKRCIACHEEAVTTGQGQPIEGFVQRGVIPTADVVIKQLRTPFKDMPSFSEAQVSDAEAAQIADYLAAQTAKAAQAAPPATLPQSGGDVPVTLPLALLLVGTGLALAGFALWRRMVKN